MIQSTRRERLDARIPAYDGGDEYIMIIAGRLLTEDRQLALIWKAEFPDRKLVILLRFPTRTISKQSKTTYAGWCERHQIEWREIRTNANAERSCNSIEEAAMQAEIRYCLTDLVIGSKTELALSKIQYAKIKTARHSLDALTAFEEKFYAICEHYRAIHEFTFKTVLNNMIFGMHDIPALHQSSADFGRIVLSYLATARLYIDTSISGASDVTSGAISKGAIQPIFSNEYDNCFSYRAMEAIRNFSQHNAFPATSTSHGGKWNEDRSRSHFYCTFHFAPNKHESASSLKASIRREIEANGGKFDLVDGTRDHFGALCRIHQNLRMMFAPTKIDAIRELDEWRSAWTSETGQTKFVALAAIEAVGDELKDGSEIYIGHEMDSYRESIEEKTSHLQNMEKRRIELQ